LRPAYVDEVEERHGAKLAALPAGQTGLGYTCIFTTTGLRSELNFQDRDPAANEARFAAAQPRKAELEAAYGAALTFEPLAGRKGRCITERRPGAIEQTEAWDEYIEWFIDAQTRLRKAIAAIGGWRAWPRPDLESLSERYRGSDFASRCRGGARRRR
jgi:hypothetical protein